MKTIQSLKIAGLGLALLCGGMTVMAQGNGNGKGNGHGTKIDIKTGGGGDKGKIQIKNAQDGIKVDVKSHGNGNGDKVKIDIKGDNKGDHGKTDIKIGTNDHGKGEHGHNDHHDGKGVGHDKGHPGNGNAYGHNKGGMSGREFGQARAEEARNKHKDIIIVFEKTLSAEEIHIQTAKDRIKAAYITINLMKADPKANKADIAFREATIKKAELKLSLLETQVVSGKSTLQKNQSISVSVK